MHLCHQVYVIINVHASTFRALLSECAIESPPVFALGAQMDLLANPKMQRFAASNLSIATSGHHVVIVIFLN